LFKQILLFVISWGISQHLNNVPFCSAAEPFGSDPGAEIAAASKSFEAPYEPTPMPVVNAMLRMAAVGPDQFLIDLGSGDGRIVITAAKKFGARGLGVDRNRKLVELSRKYAQKEGVADRTAFYVQDLFATDFSKADVVTLYLLPKVNLRLRPKLLQELRPGARVVSHDYHMGEWRPDEIRVVDVPRVEYGSSILYLWTIPAQAAGIWRWPLSLEGEEQEIELRFEQAFQDIQGVAKNGKGRWRLFHAALNGPRITFSFVSEINERLIRQDYEGVIQGDRMEGTVRLSGAVKETQQKWRAAKVKAGSVISPTR
jgi:hypothetical protein